jgi:uncharacterized protein (TIGR02996 family)
MPREEDFLEAIRAAPDDDGPRLVYADWLDERGDPRGEFIRLQIALAGIPADDPGRTPLERQERRLLNANWGRWGGPLRALGVERFSFGRGFIEAVATNIDTLLRSGEELFRLAPVRTLRVSGGQDQLPVLTAHVPILGRVRRLDLSLWGLTGEGLRMLVRSPNLERLEGLVLRNNHLGGHDLAAFAELGSQSLTHLDLSINPVGDVGTEHLTTLPSLANLRELLLRGSDRFAFTDLIHGPGVVALAVSPYLTRLRLLDLGANAVGDAGFARLVQSPNGQELEELGLAYNQVGLIGDAGYRELTGSCLGSLRRLVLSGNLIGAPGAQALAEWRRTKPLRCLELDQCGLGDRGAALAGSPEMRRLTRLCLQSNLISEEGAGKLARSGYLRSAVIDLRRNWKIERRVRDQLRARAPRILFD